MELSKFSPFVLHRIVSIEIPKSKRLPHGLKLRKANEGDDEFIEKLTKNSMAAYVKSTWKDPENRQRYWDINACGQSKKDGWIKRRTYLVIHGDEAVGRITMSYKPWRWLYVALKIENVHLINEFRNIGIFTNLFDELVRIAPDKKFFLEVLRTNPNAARLYFNNGFRLYRHPSEIKIENRRYDMVYEPDEVYGPSRAFYLNKFSDILEKCRDNAVIFALFLVTFNSFIPLGQAGLSNQLAWIALLVLAIVFSTYDMIAGKLYVQFKPSGSSKAQGIATWAVDRQPSMRRVFALLLLEFAMVFFNVLVIVAPYGYLVARAGIQNDNIFNDIHDAFLFYGCWHTSNFFWYVASPVHIRRKTNFPASLSWTEQKGDRYRLRDFTRHGGYAACHFGMFCLFQYGSIGIVADYFLGTNLGNELWSILVLASLVMGTIAFQSRRYLNNDFFNLSKSYYWNSEDKEGRLPDELREFGYLSMGLNTGKLDEICKVRGGIN